MVMGNFEKNFFLAPLNYERPSDNFFDYNLSNKKRFKKVSLKNKFGSNELVLMGFSEDTLKVDFLVS